MLIHQARRTRVVVLALISVLAAVTEGGGAPLTCERKGLESYLESMNAGFSCTIGPLTFSEFEVTGELAGLGGTTTVDPQFDGKRIQIQFQFGSPFSLTSMDAMTKVATIEFHVEGAPIEAAQLRFTGKRETPGLPDPGGDGATAQVEKTFTGHGERLSTILSDTETRLEDTVEFPDRPTDLDVTDTLTLTTTATGRPRRALIGSVTDVFFVPLPSSLGLVLAGAFLLFGRGSRRSRARHGRAGTR